MTAKKISTDLMIKTLVEQTDLTEKDIIKEVERIKEDMKGLITKRGALNVLGNEKKIQFIKNNKNKRGKIMDNLDSFFEKLDVSAEEFPDFLKIQNDITFTLKLESTDKKPRKYTDSYGNEKYAWNVILTDLTPKEAKTEYHLNKTYSLSLGKRAMRRFKQFWLSVGNQYDRKFTFERTGHRFQTDYVFKLVE